MKTSTFCIFVAALVLLAGSVLTRPTSALASDSVPLSSPIYDDLDRLAGMGLISTKAKQSRPYSKAEAARMALEAATNFARNDTAAPAFAMELVARVRLLLARDENSAAEPGSRLFELSFSSKALNRYVGETGGVSYDRPVSQNDLTITHIPSGVYLDIWQSISVSHKAAIIFDDGAYGTDRALVGAYETAPSYRIREWLSFDLSGKVVCPFTSVTDGRTTQFIGGAGFSLNY
jgi:hypothetical protein